MKIFKKILAGVVSAAVIVSALAVPTAALTDSMTHKKESGTLPMPNGMNFKYSTDTAASHTEASARVACSRNATLWAKIEAHGHVGYLSGINSKADMISGKSLSVSVNSTFEEGEGKIDYAIGEYDIVSVHVKSVVD